MSNEFLGRLEAVVDELAALPWDVLADPEVVEVLRRVETVKRRPAPVDPVRQRVPHHDCVSVQLAARRPW